MTPDSRQPSRSKRQSWTLGICPRCGELHCPTPNIDHMEHVYGREVVEVVPRSVAEALAEALESIAERHLPPQISRPRAADAAAEYRAAYPEETP